VSDAAERGPALADERTLQVLDFDAIRRLVAHETMTDRGTARAHTMAPARELAAIRDEQAATSEMRAIAAHDGFALTRVVDTGEAIARAARGSVLGAEDLHEVAIAAAAADAAVRRVRAAEAPVLKARCAAAVPLQGVAGRIDHAIGERGEVLDRASPALARIRRSVVAAHEQARDRCQAILRSSAFAKAVQEPIVTTRGGRFVIPVKADFAGAVPGVVHDTSSSGQTLFVEPLAALDANNRVRTLRVEEEREIERILAELSGVVGSAAGGLETGLEILADFDLSLARARVAGKMDAVAPVVAEGSTMVVRSGRHPLLGERAVAQSLVLDEETRFIVISGPNMGGKTVTLKMVGLFVVMTYCGLHLPAAEGTVVGTFDRVFAEIGDEQSIAENTSTFSAHLRRLRQISAGAGDRSLVLIDEIASGTEPASSAALAMAFLEYLLASGVHGIVTTHATELKLFAHDTDGFRNASVRFDANTYAPTYELEVGIPGQSLAFALARTMGLEGSIVERSEALLSTSQRDYEQALTELAALRSSSAAERDALALERAHVAKLQENVRGRVEALDRERRTIASQVDERLARALRDFTNELERRARERGTARPRVTQAQAALLGRVQDDVRRELGLTQQTAAPGERPANRVSPGDGVFVEALGGEGTVVDDYGDTVLVSMGSMRTVVQKRGLRVVRSGEAQRRPKSGGGAQALESASGASAELDVRGKRFVEAEPLVERWLDEAKLLGLSPLRLIHGKGTGLLGRGLQQHLREHADVASLRYGNADEGGSGVTILELH
jgi:DNA mismatch repair protein MutS2